MRRLKRGGLYDYINFICKKYSGHTSKKESQEDHIEMMGLVGECGVSMSMIVDGDRSVMTCSIRSHPNNGMHDNQKGMLGKRDKCLMPLTRVLRPTSGESKLRLEQLRKDSPPQTLFRIKGRVSTYDTFRFQSRSQSSKKHYCMGLNLFSLKTEQPVDLGEAETGNDEDCDLELQETLTIAAIRKSDPSKNFPSVSQQSTESKSEME
ncbi:unnamed protein product [Orchesella dallaii]|uniref:Uncharacterized protein n=1 Tax=Orchesella dallaii TaxID=48710 RepID=A0ABP1QI82_9HEXA